MRKKIVDILLIIICVVALVSILVGCGSGVTEEKEETNRFIEVYEDDHIRIYCDTETGVQYLYRYFSHGSGLTELLDEEGKPLLYEGSGIE